VIDEHEEIRSLIFDLQLQNMTKRQVIEAPDFVDPGALNRDPAQTGNGGGHPLLGSEHRVQVPEIVQSAIPQIPQGKLALHLLEAEDVRAAGGRGFDGPGEGREFAGILLCGPTSPAVLRVLAALSSIIEKILYIVAGNDYLLLTGEKKGETRDKKDPCRLSGHRDCYIWNTL
jgi:hypothetical protein